MPYLIRAYCKFELSYHSISEITLNTKVIVFKICVPINPSGKNRKAKIHANLGIILTKQMHL
jgi:hypothetical protein